MILETVEGGAKAILFGVPEPSKKWMAPYFDSTNEATVVTLLDHYRSQTAANRRFTLSTNVTAGMSSTLAARANASIDGLRWEYAGPPEVQTIRPGINNVRINLAGEIRNPLLDD
jgi:hypothetical protein